MKTHIALAGVLLSLTTLAATPLQAAPPPAKSPVKAAPPARAPMKSEQMAPATASGIGQGDMEFSVFGMFISPDDFDSITILGTSAGYYFTDNLVIKASLFMVESAGSRNGNLGLGADYLFGAFKPQMINTPLVPYAGGAFLIGIGDGENMPEVHGGLKQFIGERVSVNYELQRWLGDLKSTNLLAQLSFYF